MPEDLIHVTADPVIRVKKADPALGLSILEREGCPRREDVLTVGWAVKARRRDPVFFREIEKSIRWLREEYGADSVLIPFFHSEDLEVCEAIAGQLEGQAGCLRQKYLSEETLSIIGCMDLLVGVRLHSLIYAAVMGVPMIGISYDPKVDSFLSSIQQPTLCSVEEFSLEKFQARLPGDPGPPGGDPPDRGSVRGQPYCQAGPQRGAHPRHHGAVPVRAMLPRQQKYTKAPPRLP